MDEATTKFKLRIVQAQLTESEILSAARMRDIDTLRAEVESLKADKERFDWLETQTDYVMPSYDPHTKKWYVYHDNPEKDRYRDTLRSAIDAARSEEKS